tara:strand:- start:19524 stop:20585 length:1062 start_codon:yes stop_codon:yes gene_type:complete
MPTGSKDPDVLLAWILDSMGLVRWKAEGTTVDEEQGAIHRIIMQTFLKDPLIGWDNAAISDFSGLSMTAVHNQMQKLREAGIIASKLSGRWHVNVLRGGSMAKAMELVSAQTRVIAKMRLDELGDVVKNSEKRMNMVSEDSNDVFRIDISESGPTPDGGDRLDAWIVDMGIAGDRVKIGDDLPRRVLIELAESERPLTLQTLSDRTESTRSRTQRIIERLRDAGIIERVAMRDRIAMDVYAGLMRQYNARGEEWLLGRGGLGRLEETVTKDLITGAKKDNLSIEKVEDILTPVPIESQRILLNTLGGRMPYGYRVAGSDSDAVTERVMQMIERNLRRLRTVAKRLDDSINDSL